VSRGGVRQLGQDAPGQRVLRSSGPKRSTADGATSSWPPEIIPAGVKMRWRLTVLPGAPDPVANDDQHIHEQHRVDQDRRDGIRHRRAHGNVPCPCHAVARRAGAPGAREHAQPGSGAFPASEPPEGWSTGPEVLIRSGSRPWPVLLNEPKVLLDAYRPAVQLGDGVNDFDG
jgi:hypothetical protein